MGCVDIDYNKNDIKIMLKSHITCSFRKVMRTRNRGQRTETAEDIITDSEDEYSHDGKSSKQNIPPKSTSTMKLRNKSAEKLVADKKDGLSNFVIQYSKRSYSFIYPPSKKLHEMPETKNIDTAAKTSRESSTFLTKKWSENLSTLLIDESNSVKFASISIFIEKCRTVYHNCPPFLIVTHVDQFTEWIDQIKFWTNQTIYICSNNKNERHDVNDLSLFFDQGPEDQFGVILISFNQFNADLTVLPKFKWASVIFDCPEMSLDISSIDYHSKTLVITSNESREEYEQCYLSSEPGTSFTDTEIYHITPQAAAADGLFAETLVNCPLIQIQNEKYLQIIQDNREILKNWAANEADPHGKLCSIIKLLRQCGDHPSLVDPSIHSELISMSGKTSILSRLLSSQKTDKRRSILIASPENMRIIETVFADNRVSYVSIIQSDTEQEIQEKIEQFEAEEFSRVLLLDPTHVNAAISQSKAQTIIAYDLGWTPLDSGPEIILWNAKVQSTQQYRLISQDTIEQTIFEHFWNHREKNQMSYEEKETSTLIESINILQRSLILAHKNLGAIRSPHRSILKDSTTVAYFDTAAFNLPDIEWSEVYLEPPEKPLPPEEKPKTVRPLTPAQYWTHDNLMDFISLFPNFPWGRWSIYDKHNRPIPELIKLWVVFAKSLFRSATLEVPHVAALIKEHGKFDQKRFINSLTSWGQVFPLLKAEDILIDLENWPTIEALCYEIENPSDISLPTNETEIPEQQLKEFIFNAYKDGLTAVPDDSREIFRQTLRILEKALKEKGLAEKANSKSSRNKSKNSSSHQQEKIITEPQPKKFDTSDHNKILNTLMTFGLPNIESFIDIAELNEFPTNVIQEYIENVMKYCSQTSEDEPRNAQALGIIGRIVKYHAQKIPKRIELFNKIRESQFDTDSYSAEELEILAAVSAHGFNSSSFSPSLMSIFAGTPSEIKIHSKIKAIFENFERPKICQKLPDQIDAKMPLKLNDMQMLLNVGKIDKKYVKGYYVYPLGYKVAVISRMINTDDDGWYECEIKEENKKLVFNIKILDTETNLFSGSTPDEAVQKLKAKLQERGIRGVSLDGHEFFGLNSPLVHKIFSENEELQKGGYFPRFFSTNLILTSKWPEIGKFSKDAEKPAATVATTQSTHFKFKKKQFGNLQQPIVIDLMELMNSDAQRYSMDITTNITNNNKLVSCFENWIDFSDFLPQ